MAEFRHVLNKLLIRDNTSKKDVAEYCGVAPSAVSHWANGSAIPTVPNLIKLSELFKVSINYLLGTLSVRYIAVADIAANLTIHTDSEIYDEKYKRPSELKYINKDSKTAMTQQGTHNRY